MKFPRRRFLHLAAGAAALVAVSAPAGAQEWPTRPVTMMVPFAVGGATDVLARLVATRLSELLGQPVIIENQGGAGGMTGAARVAKAPPDGYLLELGGNATHAYSQTVYKNPLYNAATDFAPVALIVELPLVLIVRNDLPVSNLQEFIAYAKVNQTRMQYGSAGVGSGPHLACALLNAAIGIGITHIPYRGGGPALQDMIGGRIDYQCATLPSAITLIESSLVKPIAVLTKNRWPSLANLPSAHEQGLTNFEAGGWYGFFLPKGTPGPVVQKLHDATVAVMETPRVQERLKEIGFALVVPERRSPEYLQKFVESEIAKWGGPIKASGVRLD
jgi:tripartite-type tricarboxylate transporter receptor subunit TctC